MNIGTVVEGPTDRLVIKSIINSICPGEHRFFDLQPQGAGDTFNEMGTGWKGVQHWCKETWKIHGSSLEMILNEGSEAPLDLLIIHLDADIVLENDLQAGMGDPIEGIPLPCPPASQNAQAIRPVVIRWLNLDTLPNRVILAIPSQDTENWTFAALHPTDGLCQNVDYECIQEGRTRNNHPAYRLTLEEYGKHLKRDGSRIKKPVNLYRPIADQVGINWETVCRICTQASAFHQAVVEYFEALL